MTPPAPASSSTPTSAARAAMSPRSVTRRPSTARTNSPAASSLAQSPDRDRSTSSASSAETILATGAALASSPLRGRNLSSPTALSATRSSTDSTPSSAPSSFFSSDGDEAATASTTLDRSITATLAPSTSAAARATAGRPAPDSIASESASSVPGSAAEAVFSLGVTREILAAGPGTPGLAKPPTDVFPVVDDDDAYAEAHGQQGGEDEER